MFAQLSRSQTALVAEAWRRRKDAARAEGYAYVHAFINEGHSAGEPRALALAARLSARCAARRARRSRPDVSGQSTFAGIDLGAGHVLTVAPEDGAAALHRALQPR